MKTEYKRSCNRIPVLLHFQISPFNSSRVRLEAVDAATMINNHQLLSVTVQTKPNLVYSPFQAARAVNDDIASSLSVSEHHFNFALIKLQILESNANRQQFVGKQIMET
jgi:hypothetical protein